MASYGSHLDAHGLGPPTVHGAHAVDLCAAPAQAAEGGTQERYAPRLKRLREMLRYLPTEGAEILMDWLGVDPEAPTPRSGGAWCSTSRTNVPDAHPLPLPGHPPAPTGLVLQL